MRFFPYILLVNMVGLSASADRVLLGVGLSENLTVPGISRVAVSHSRLVRARAAPPSTLVLTGLHPGRATVTVWAGNRIAASLDIQVVASSAFDLATDRGKHSVVKVALEFLEMDLSVSRLVGLRWPEAIQFSPLATFEKTTGLNYSAAFSSARGMLQHLMKEGWAKLLAHPELAVRLGEEAIFHSGGEVPVATSTENHGRFHREIQWKPFGLTVRVRPQSADYLHVQSDIRVEISELNRGAAVEGVPGLTKRTLETKMNSIDGETVVLTGLVRHSLSKDKHSTPGLHSLPVVGPLFAAHADYREENELFIAVTFSFTEPHKERAEVRDARRKFSNFSMEANP